MVHTSASRPNASSFSVSQDSKSGSLLSVAIRQSEIVFLSSGTGVVVGLVVSSVAAGCCGWLAAGCCSWKFCALGCGRIPRIQERLKKYCKANRQPSLPAACSLVRVLRARSLGALSEESSRDLPSIGCCTICPSQIRTTGETQQTKRSPTFVEIEPERLKLLLLCSLDQQAELTAAQQ